MNTRAEGRRRGVAVVALFTMLTVVFAYPLSIRPSDRVLGVSPDTNLTLWSLAWDAHAFTHRPWAIFEANIYYPLRHTLAYSENFIGSALFAAPVLWITSNAVLALNLVTLLSVILAGVGAYWLARSVGVSVGGAIACGIVFAFSPARFMRITQLHLATIQWVPFALAAFERYLTAGGRRDLRLAFVFVSLQALTSGHGAVFVGVALLLRVAWHALRGGDIRPARWARDVGLTGAAALVPALAAFVPYLLLQQELGLRRTLENWTVSPASYFASLSHVHTWLLSWFPDARINEAADAFLFPGWLPIALALCAVAPARRPRAAARAAAVVLDVVVVGAAVIGAAVAIGGPLRMRVGGAVVFTARYAWRAWLVCAVAIAGRIAVMGRVPFAPCAGWDVWRTDACRGVVGFYALLTGVSVWLTLGPPVGLWPYVYWLPGLNFIRVPSRFMLLAILGLAVLSGLGLDRAIGWVSDTGTPQLDDERCQTPTSRAEASVGVRHRPRATLGLPVSDTAAITAIVGALMIAEFACFPLGTTPMTLTPPAADRWLASQPTPFVVAEAPVPTPRNLGASERYQSVFMLHSTAHWQKTVHGYSGFRLPLHADLYQQLTRFPDETSLTALERLGVTYVVVHLDMYGDGERGAIDERLRAYAPRLTRVYADETARIFTLPSASAHTE